MTEDFIFIEENENGELMIDAITPSRLRLEWEGVLCELKQPQVPISPKLWGNLIDTYKSLLVQEPETCQEMLQNFFSELSELIINPEFSSEYGNMMSLFYDLLKLYNQPLLGLDKKYILPFFRKLQEVSLFCKEETCNFLELSLEPYCSDDIIDDSDESAPFVDFIIEGFPSFSPVSEKIRNVIESYINGGERDSYSYFIPRFIEKCVSVIEQISEISPTIPYVKDSSLISLLTWITNTVYQTHDAEGIRAFNTEFTNRVLNKLNSQPDEIAFYTCSALLAGISSYQCLEIFINKILDKSEFFCKKVQNWILFYPNELLQITRTLVSMRCSAVLNAFFFVQNIDKSYQLYSFPSIPIQFASEISNESLANPESYHIFSEFNQELPRLSPHIISLFSFIESMYDSFWQLTEDKMELLTDTIERLAGCCTPQAYYFCFTQGKYIFAQTAKHITELERADKKKRKIFCRFIKMMNSILSTYPQPKL